MVAIPERARRYIARSGPAISGSGGHNHTLSVARALVRGFSLSESEAMPIFQAWNQGNADKWTDHELLHKLRSAAHGPGDNGFLLRNDRPGGAAPMPAHRPSATYTPPPPRTFDLTALARIAKGDPGEADLSALDLVWFAERSEVDPATVSAQAFLSALYAPGEHVIVFSEYRSQGQAVWPREPIPTSSSEGVWFLAQPVDGKSRPNPRTQKMSRRSEESVLAWRWLVLESDEAPLQLWLGALARCWDRVAAITTSGKRSVHALIRVDARSKKDWDAKRAQWMHNVTCGADPGAITAVRLTRLPACLRGNSQQKLLYFAPSAPPTFLCHIIPRRDIVQDWIARAQAAFRSGDPAQLAQAAHGCRYYAKFDSQLTTAAQELEADLLALPLEAKTLSHRGRKKES